MHAGFDWSLVSVEREGDEAHGVDGSPGTDPKADESMRAIRVPVGADGDNVPVQPSRPCTRAICDRTHVLSHASTSLMERHTWSKSELAPLASICPRVMLRVCMCVRVGDDTRVPSTSTRSSTTALDSTGTAPAASIAGKTIDITE